MTPAAPLLVLSKGMFQNDGEGSTVSHNREPILSLDRNHGTLKFRQPATLSEDVTQYHLRHKGTMGDHRSMVRVKQ